jgi:hypothetical protein
MRGGQQAVSTLLAVTPSEQLAATVKVHDRPRARSKLGEAGTDGLSLGMAFGRFGPQRKMAPFRRPERQLFPTSVGPASSRHTQESPCISDTIDVAPATPRNIFEPSTRTV